MASFYAKVNEARVQADELGRYVNELSNAIRAAEGIRNSLEIGQVYSRLQNVINDLYGEREKMSRMQGKLNAILDQYGNTELRIVNHAQKGADNGNPDTNGNDTGSNVVKGYSGQEDAINYYWEILKEKWDEFSEDVGMTFLEFISFIIDIGKIVGTAGITALMEDNIDWEKWFMEYVPRDVSDATILSIFELLSFPLWGNMSDDIVQKHKTENTKNWENYSNKGDKYIEKQSEMNMIRYGNLTGDNNTCGVIATYNALQSLTNGNSPDSFPDLIAHFEQAGIAAQGEFGTSPHAINNFFEQNGYDTKMITGDSGNAAIGEIQNNYDTYIMLAYNDETTLAGMVHYVSITCENGKYVIHNDKYSGASEIYYDTLQDAMQGYNDGTGEPICLIGIGNK